MRRTTNGSWKRGQHKLSEIQKQLPALTQWRNQAVRTRSRASERKSIERITDADFFPFTALEKGLKRFKGEITIVERENRGLEPDSYDVPDPCIQRRGTG